MSAFGVGTRQNEAETSTAFNVAAANPTPRELFTSLFAKYVKWIPADVIAAYSAFVATNWVHQTERFAADPTRPAPAPDSKLWWIALAFCPVLVTVGALLSKNWPKLIRRCVFAAIGFGIWTASIPHSLWETADWFVESQAVYQGLILLLGGGVVAAIGEVILAAGVWGDGRDWKRLL